MKENLQWKCTEFRIRKYASENDFNNGKIMEEIVKEGNVITKHGIISLMKIWSGDAAAHLYDQANTYIGVGQNSGSIIVGSEDDWKLAAETPGTFDSALVAYSPLDASPDGIVITLPNKITYTATFGTTVGNFQWKEWAIFNGNPNIPGIGRTNPAGPLTYNNGVYTNEPFVDFDVVMLNHRGETMGTKASGSVWTISCDIQLTSSI